MKRIGVYVVFLILLSSLVAAAGSGGGGSGGGGSGSSNFITFKSSDLKENNKNLNKGVAYDITLSNKDKYKLRLKEINNLDGTFVFFTTNFEIIWEGKIFVVEEKSFDLNNNGIDDIRLKVNFYTDKIGGVNIEDLQDNNDPNTLINKEIVIEEEKLKCTNLKIARERVRCRLTLGESAYKDDELLYLPEECAAKSGVSRSKCMEIYSKVQDCWYFSVGKPRMDCVRKQFNIGDLKSEKLACDRANNREGCVKDLKEKAYNVIKFRFYDLEERAEQYFRTGVEFDVVVDFITKAEESKVKFNNAKTKKERIDIILDVRNAWIEFLMRAKE